MRVARAAIILSVFLAACAARGSVTPPGDRPANTGGTISGLVRASSPNTPLAGRKVTATNTATGEKIETVTSSNGGYTMKVATGNYRLEVELRPGEALSTRPDDVHITGSDLDSGRNFVITVKPSNR